MNNMSFTPEQHEFRRQFIGASQAAGIMGLDPNNPPIKVYNYMVHGVYDDTQSLAARRGVHMEPLIAELFEEEYRSLGVRLIDPKSVWPETYGALVDKEISFISASLDRYIEGTNEPVEIKDISHPAVLSEFGREGSEDVPLKYHVQVMQQLRVMRTHCHYAGLPLPVRGYLCAMLRGNTFRTFPIEWDEAKWTEIYAHLSAFMTQYVIPQIPPPITSDEHYKMFLQERRLAMGVNDAKREDDSDETVAKASELITLQGMSKVIDSRITLLKNEFMQIIGDGKGIQGRYGSIQVNGGGMQEKIDFEKAVYGLRDLVGNDEEFNKILKECTYTIPSKKPFVQAYPKKGWIPEATYIDGAIKLISSGE